jgi:hypothetical protein
VSEISDEIDVLVLTLEGISARLRASGQETIKEDKKSSMDVLEPTIGATVASTVGVFEVEPAPAPRVVCPICGLACKTENALHMHFGLKHFDRFVV